VNIYSSFPDDNHAFLDGWNLSFPAELANAGSLRFQV
jgi:hypothetical protein